jgi:quercetin dioxygenase-like cupin family protein
MKGFLRGIPAALAVVLLAPAALAGDAGAAAAAATPGSRAPAIVMITPDELKWMPNPANADVQMAVVYGDPAKGSHGSFQKFKPGFNAGLHTHSSDLRLAVISGTVLTTAEGGPEKKLPPGSYEYQPGGVKHVTKCDPSGPCVIFVVANGKFDFMPAEQKK